ITSADGGTNLKRAAAQRDQERGCRRTPRGRPRSAVEVEAQQLSARMLPGKTRLELPEPLGRDDVLGAVFRPAHQPETRVLAALGRRAPNGTRRVAEQDRAVLVAADL